MTKKEYHILVAAGVAAIILFGHLYYLSAPRPNEPDWTRITSHLKLQFGKKEPLPDAKK